MSVSQSVCQSVSLSVLSASQSVSPVSYSCQSVMSVSQSVSPLSQSVSLVINPPVRHITVSRLVTLSLPTTHNQTHARPRQALCSRPLIWTDDVVLLRLCVSYGNMAVGREEVLLEGYQEFESWAARSSKLQASATCQVVALAEGLLLGWKWWGGVWRNSPYNWRK